MITRFFVYNFFQSIIVNIPYIYGYLVISWLIESRLVSDDGAVFFCLKIWIEKKILLSSQRVTKK